MEIKKNISLQKMNTFAIDVKAKYYVTITSKDDFFTLLQTPEFKNNKKLFLWWWSNILLTKDFDWLIIHNNILGKQINNEDNNHITITVWWWENRDKLVMWSCNNHYTGIENLVAIPWLVGASPIQNIGAYGVEAKDTIVAVGWIDIEKKKYRTLSNEECQFSYRSSIFKKELSWRFFVTDVTFMRKKINIDTSWQKKYDYSPQIQYGAIISKLEEKWVELTTLHPQQVAATIREIRENKLPDYKQTGTAGSFFKNPIISYQTLEKVHQIDSSIKHRAIDEKHCKIPAWQLIENCGLKWYKKGNAWTYQNHALILVNNGGATGEEIVAVAHYIQQTVQDKYGVLLEPEVNYI